MTLIEKIQCHVTLDGECWQWHGCMQGAIPMMKHDGKVGQRPPPGANRTRRADEGSYRYLHLRQPGVRKPRAYGAQHPNSNEPQEHG